MPICVTLNGMVLSVTAIEARPYSAFENEANDKAFVERGFA